MSGKPLASTWWELMFAKSTTNFINDLVVRSVRMVCLPRSSSTVQASTCNVTRSLFVVSQFEAARRQLWQTTAQRAPKVYIIGCLLLDSVIIFTSFWNWCRKPYFVICRGGCLAANRIKQSGTCRLYDLCKLCPMLATNNANMPRQAT